MRNRFELNDNLTTPFRQALARAQEKRNALPAPIVDIRLYCDESFGIGRLAKIRFVAFDCIALDRALDIFTGDDIAFSHRTDCPQNLDLFVPNGGGIKAGRWLHRDQREKLQHMVLHHVPQRAGIVIKTCATFKPDCLAYGDLDMRNCIGVPQGFKQHIAKTQCHQVLNSFLAQIMIDAERSFFGEYSIDGVIDMARRCKIIA